MRLFVRKSVFFVYLGFWLMVLPGLLMGATFIISSQNSVERDKARSKPRGLTEEAMAKAIADEEDRSGKVAAERIPDEMRKIALMGNLSGALHLLPNPVRPGEATTEQKIIPCTPVRLEATVWNTGETPSLPGIVQVMYKLPDAPDGQKDPLFFETEKVPLSSLQPGEKKTVVFETVHTLPCLSDFIQEKWAKRAYELAFTPSNGLQEVLTNLKLTFSGYYYVSPSTPQLNAKPVLQNFLTT